MQTSTSNWTILRIGIYGNIACPVGKYDMKSTVYGCFLSECMPMSIPVNTTPPALLSFGLPAREQMKKADTLLAYLQKASSAGLRESNFYISELQTNLRRIRQLDFDPENNINAVFGRTEFLLTKAYLRYVCGQRFGYVQPNQIFNRLEQTDTTQKLLSADCMTLKRKAWIKNLSIKPSLC